MLIDNHTRVCCRVLSVLTRGGTLEKIRPGVWTTGEKRSTEGKTLREALLVVGGKEAPQKLSEEVKRTFKGARVTFSEDLKDRLIEKGWVDGDGEITTKGRIYLSDVRSSASRVVRAKVEDISEVLSDTGFLRPGMSLEGCRNGAVAILDVITRLSPTEVPNR